MLLPHHEDEGATLGEGPGGARVVTRTDDPAMELEHAGAALLHDAGHLAPVHVTGSEARSFLANLLASDVEGLPEAGAAQPSLLLTPKGKIVAQMALRLHGPADVTLLVEAPHRGALVAELTTYARFSDVTIADGHDDHAVVLLTGPRAPEVLQEGLGMAAPEPGDLVDLGEGWTAAWGSLGTPHGLLLTGPRDAGATLWKTLRAAVEDVGGSVAGWEAMDALRIREGVPAAHTELADERLPAEAGLEGVVSFTKGCFVGQEVAARVRNLGEVQRRLVRLASRGALDPGADLVVEDETVGWVTSATDVGKGEPRALGFLRRAHVEEGVEVQAGETVARVLGAVER